MATVLCDKCGAECVPSGCSTGYGVFDDGKRHCYACCAEYDKSILRTERTWTGYLDQKAKTVGNWPGSLKLPLLHGTIRVGRHNIAGKRYDVWFRFEGREFHAVQYGDNTQIVRCKLVSK